MRGLVFSGGGAFGAYQAGVWRALEESGYHPDLLAGTSIGAINATAVAGGMSGAGLVRWWLDPQPRAVRWNWPPRGWGLLSNHGLEARAGQLLDRLQGRSGAPRLLVTVTELPGLAIRVVEGPDVTAQILTASCSVPVVFPPVCVAGRWFCDGGVFDRLPIGPAMDAGATDIIAVDLLAQPPSVALRALLNLLIRARQMLRKEPARPVAGGATIRLVAPAEPLGRLRDTLRWERRNVERWIGQGYQDAMKLVG